MLLTTGIIGIILSLIADALPFAHASYSLWGTAILGIIGLILGAVALKEKGNARIAGIIAVILAVISFIELGIIR